ncbi:hypothetical protein JTB14_032216 [Gonioctena quinquepunctata]|nr:hypothetical protein JTB14_032216 [Gonioctena quinquepunctata]
MDCGTRLEKAKPGDSRTDKELYQSKIGSLLYLAMGTRPDIAHTSTIHLSVNPVMHQRSKHIDIHYHYTRERFLNADVNITYVASKENFADLFTKPLGREQFHYLLSKFMESSH